MKKLELEIELKKDRVIQDEVDRRYFLEFKVKGVVISRDSFTLSGDSVCLPLREGTLEILGHDKNAGYIDYLDIINEYATKEENIELRLVQEHKRYDINNVVAVHVVRYALFIDGKEEDYFSIETKLKSVEIAFTLSSREKFFGERRATYDDYMNLIEKYGVKHEKNKM